MIIDVFSKDFIAGFICAVVCVAAFPKQTISSIKTLVMSLFAKLTAGQVATNGSKRP